jgi:hypothetical protein
MQTKAKKIKLGKVMYCMRRLTVEFSVVSTPVYSLCRNDCCRGSKVMGQRPQFKMDAGGNAHAEYINHSEFVLRQ